MRKKPGFMPNLVSTVVILILTSLLLGACGGTPSPTATAPAPTTQAANAAKPNTKVSLVYLLSEGWNKSSDQELANRFEAETGIHIDFQIIPADQYFNVLKVKLAAQTAPDIFGGQTGAGQLTSDYNVEQNAVDLSGEEWVKREDPISVAETTLKGKVYGLTLWDTKGGTYVLNYNKRIFQQLGLSVPKTYAEFRAVCAKILAAGITPIYEPIADGWHHVLWFPHQGPRWEELTPGLKDNLNANKSNFTGNSQMLTTLQQLDDMYTAGFFGPDALTNTNDQIAAKMATGKYGMVLNPLGATADFQRLVPDAADNKIENWGYFVMPLSDNQTVAIDPGGPSKFIYKNSSHVEEAKAYLRFLTRPDNLQYLLDHETSFSSLNFSGIKDKFTPEQNKFFANYPKQGIVYQVSINYLNPQWLDMGKDLTAMFLGALKPEDVLRKIDDRRATLAKQVKDPAWNN